MNRMANSIDPDETARYFHSHLALYCLQNYLLLEIDHEIFSVVILTLALIQEGQLSVSGKKCAHYWLTA